MVRAAAGGLAVLLLVAADGGSLARWILDLVAEPVEVTGELVAYDDLEVPRADPARIRRLGRLAGRRERDHG